MELVGQLLIASPGMGDPRFAGSVVYLCAHSAEGAMGLIINKPMPQVSFSMLIAQLDISAEPGAGPAKVHFGGPVEGARGFLLHSPDYRSPEGTLVVDDRFAMTATVDVLEALAKARGPRRALLALGYAGWAPMQLEAEIGLNGWLTCPADPDLVFSENDASKWERALKTIGVDALALSATAGRA